ncbi:uncharacterized protein LOC135388837 [Ornithodoros turicata]|uniref:uncharacterized protein LOC135388837 n=1 Tax=Ornithodoros turicata TaxID=34597 RepID=UPI003138C407
MPRCLVCQYDPIDAMLVAVEREHEARIENLGNSPVVLSDDDDNRVSSPPFVIPETDDDESLDGHDNADELLMWEGDQSYADFIPLSGRVRDESPDASPEFRNDAEPVQGRRIVELREHVVENHPSVTERRFLPFFVTDEAFDGTATRYTLLCSPHDDNVDDLRLYLPSIAPVITRVLEAYPMPFKFCLCSKALMVKDGADGLTSHLLHVNLHMRVVHNRQEIEGAINAAIAESSQRVENYAREGSGFTSNDVQCVDLKLTRLKPKRIGCTIELPEMLKKKTKTLTNVKLPPNHENECFKYSVLALLHPLRSKPNLHVRYHKYMNPSNPETRVTYWPPCFPVTYEDIALWERKNKISVYIYVFDEQTSSISTGRVPCTLYQDKVHLLEVREHFYGIRKFSTFMGRGDYFYCEKCTSGYRTRGALEQHERLCRDVNEVILEMPKAGESVSFTKIQYMHPYPYFAVLDTESMLEKDALVKDASSVHRMSSYSIVLVRSCDGKIMDVDGYLGPNAAEKCLLSLKRFSEQIDRLNRLPSPLVMSMEDHFRHASATHCEFCGIEFNRHTRKVSHHDHTRFVDPGSSNFVATLCDTCNLTCRNTKELVVCVHNLQYDLSSLLRHMHVLNLGEPWILASSSEKIRGFNIGDLHFRDTTQFFNLSLSNLVETLLASGGESAFHCTRQMFGDRFRRLLKKGIYPYTFVGSFEAYNLPALPPKEAFKSDLNDEEITDEDYQYALEIFELFKCKNLGDYTRLYVTLDACQLCDVVLYFRKIALETDGMDILRAMSLASYAWSSALKLTNVKLELISDQEMYETIEKGIRGGICNSFHRYCRANHEGCDDYDPQQEKTFIQYLDVNSLYPYAMTFHLPTGGFEWVDPSRWSEIDFLNIPHDSEVGYVYVVDLSYPEELHALTRDFPLAPEHRYVDENELSPYQHHLKDALSLNAPPTKKLLLTCHDKERYVVHYALLALYVRLGMKIKRVHNILSFHQDNFLRTFVQRNVALRNAATTKFERLLYKTMSNSTFGKSIQNVRRMKRYAIAYDKESALRKASSVDSQHFHILSDKCILYEMKQRRIKCTHPLYVGFAILEISKVRMYSFIYESLFSRLTCPVQLIYSDTDSIIFSLTCESLEEQLMKIESELDLSSYPPDHPLFNDEHANQMGFFKDETGGGVIQEVVAIRAKMYSILLAGSHKQIARAKGVKKGVVRKHLLHEVYRDSLFNEKAVSQKQCTIQSIKQTMYTISRLKKSLVPYDDKRYLVDAVHSFPYGSCEYATENPEESPRASSSGIE